MSNFTFNGSNFNAVAANCYVLGRSGFGAPTRDVQTINVPGRSVPLTIDNNRWNTVTGSYRCVIPKNYATVKIGLINWLSSVGFLKLTDTFDTGVYRKAKYTGITENKVVYDTAAQIDINFEVSPERWTTAGDTAQTVTSGSTINNATAYVSKPLYRINGSGNFTLTVNGNSVSFDNNVNGITIDCDICRAYNGATPKESGMTGSFDSLLLNPGNNTISWTGSGVTSVTVKPRWWTL